MSQEVILYSDQRGVRVTGHSVTVDHIAYPLANLTYVAARVERPSRIGPFLIIAVGLSFLAERIAQRSFGVAILAVIVAAMGAILLKECKPLYRIDLSVVAGERAPVLRGSEGRITAIANAINEAILRLRAMNAASAPLARDSEAPALSVHS